MKLGAARTQAPIAWRLIAVMVPRTGSTFSYRLDRSKLRQVRRRARADISCAPTSSTTIPRSYGATIFNWSRWNKPSSLKGDLAIRPIFHQEEARIEAHIFVAFLAYCLHVTLGRRLHALAPGLTPRRVLEKFSAIQMIDVHVPTTDGRELVLTRQTEPQPELRLLLDKLRLELLDQPAPQDHRRSTSPASKRVVQTFRGWP
jgi:hypothetical protein